MQRSRQLPIGRILLPLIVAAAIFTSVSPAAATVTIGQVATGTPLSCGGPTDWVQPTVSSGSSYVVPGDGTIISWGTMARPDAAQDLKVKVFRPVGGLTYKVVGEDRRDNLAPGVLNTFPTNIEVKAGDVLGLNSLDTGAGCVFPAPGETPYFSGGDQPPGGQVIFVPGADQRVNVNAEIVPSSAFSFGQTTRNKKKGTATLTLELPGPGELTVAGKGVREATARGFGATTARSIPAAGQVALTIKAKGKKRKKLNRNGKVTVTPQITYTPTGGSPGTQSWKVKLKKR